MKKVLLFLIVILSVFLIHLKNTDDEVYFLALGDSYSLGMTPYNGYDYGFNDYVKDYLSDKNVLEEYIVDFSKSGYRSVDLLRDILDNKSILINNDVLTIQQALIKSDLVTLSIGTNDINSSINLDIDTMYINDVMSDMESLLVLLRKYCKEKIIAVGYIVPNENYEVVNSLYEQLCNKYNIIYINSYELLNDGKYFPNPNNIHPSKEGYHVIADKIIDNLDLK